MQISSAILLKINHDFPKKILVGKTGENLKEAKQLVAFCKGKLQHVEDEVNKIMEGKE